MPRRVNMMKNHGIILIIYKNNLSIMSKIKFNLKQTISIIKTIVEYHPEIH